MSGRPRLSCMDGAKVTLGSRGVPVEALQCSKYNKLWRLLVHI